MKAKAIKFRWCIKRPNGQLWVKTVAASAREAWWQFVLAQDGAAWVARARVFGIRYPLSLGPTFHREAKKRKWQCVKVRVTVEER